MKRYLLRIRLGLAAAFLLSAAATSLLVWALLRGDILVFGITAAWFAALLVFGGLIIWASVRDNRPAARAARPRRFLVHDRGFTAPWPRTRLYGSILTLQMVPLPFGQTLADIIQPEEQTILFFPVYAFGVAMLALLVYLHLVVPSRRDADLTLTPEGIHWRNILLHRFIPWPALAAGGPPRPHPTARVLILSVARPELLTKPGIRLFALRPIHYPYIDLTVDVQPDFLADAIRWYVEHPADRAAIGTAAEHDRLVAALTPGEQAVPAQ